MAGRGLLEEDLKTRARGHHIDSKLLKLLEPRALKEVKLLPESNNQKVDILRETQNY